MEQFLCGTELVTRHYHCQDVSRRRLRDGFKKTYWVRCGRENCSLLAGPYKRLEADRLAYNGWGFPEL